MLSFSIQTPSEQVAAHLRERILSEQYRKVMPGKAAIAKELGVDPKTVALAMEILEKQKLLVPQGAGKPRLIVLPDGHGTGGLKLVMQSYEAMDRTVPYIIEMAHQLAKHGHKVSYAKRSLVEMKMDTHKIARQVRDTPGDAWLIMAGSAEVLEWFSRQPIPCHALFGRVGSLDIAATRVLTSESYREIVRCLVGHGHSRIVLLAREERRKPNPGQSERAFLDELRNQGIETGDYNLPNWDDNADGLRRCLDSLFATTPPTALIVEQVEVYLATQEHLLRKGIRAPGSLSIICTQPDFALSWCHPRVAHLTRDEAALIRHVVRWANNTALGKSDRKQVFVKAKFIQAGTIGPVPHGRG